MVMSKAEAGRLGAAKTKENNVNRYLLNPSRCTECDKSLDYEKRHNKFCSKSCAATFNNKQRESTLPFCLNGCGNRVKRSVAVYCSNNCQQRHREQEIYNQWKLGEHVECSHRTCRSVLINFEGRRCSVCNKDEWNGSEIPIELDHIDGNYENNSYSNLRLICPNCHAQTDTYKGKNSGKGRAYRRERYTDGKSY